jgi:hypothetical protein
MPTLILSTLALLGCAFLIYVFFHWLRDELNPKRPVKRIQRRHSSRHHNAPTSSAIRISEVSKEPPQVERALPVWQRRTALQAAEKAFFFRRSVL